VKGRKRPILKKAEDKDSTKRLGQFPREVKEPGRTKERYEEREAGRSAKLNEERRRKSGVIGKK
jgi:hypothetical protein